MLEIQGMSELDGWRQSVKKIIYIGGDTEFPMEFLGGKGAELVG